MNVFPWRGNSALPHRGRQGHACRQPPRRIMLLRKQTASYFGVKWKTTAAAWHLITQVTMISMWVGIHGVHVLHHLRASTRHSHLPSFRNHKGNVSLMAKNPALARSVGFVRLLSRSGTTSSLPQTTDLTLLRALALTWQPFPFVTALVTTFIATRAL